jgi:hypothetical protein
MGHYFRGRGGSIDQNIDPPAEQLFLLKGGCWAAVARGSPLLLELWGPGAELEEAGLREG